MNRIYQNIRTCNITIDVTKNHHQKIKLYTVCIDVTMPKKPLVIRKQHNNLYIAIRDGFYAAEKLLDKYSKRKQTAYKSGWSIKNQNYSPTQLL
jgi:ribosome-associated translation inhibitor RaiA